MAASGDAGEFLVRTLLIFNHDAVGLKDGATVSRVRVYVSADEAFLSIRDLFDALSEEIVVEGELRLHCGILGGGGINENYRVITLILKKYGNLPLCLENYALFSLPPIFTTILYTYPSS